MRLNLAAISTACALLATVWALHGYAQPAGAPNRPTIEPGGSASLPPAERGHSARVDTTPSATATWRETHAGLEEADTRDCLGCHEDMASHSHPVDVDYEAVSRRSSGGLRSIEEVRARGVVLRGGKVGCLTCHSPASPWAHFLAVPRELARARPTTAESEGDEPNAAKERAVGTPPKEGTEVDSRPLCVSCHLM